MNRIWIESINSFQIQCITGVQGLFLTSSGQRPHGWPMVHHPMASGFPIPRGCCLGLSIPRFSLLCLVRNAAVFGSPLPHPVTGPVPASHTSSRVYTTSGRQQPRGAGPLDPHPSRDSFVLLARVAPILSPLFCAHVSRSQGAVARPLPHSLPGPVTSSHPATHVYIPAGRQQPNGTGPLDRHPSGDRFLLLPRVVPIPCLSFCAQGSKKPSLPCPSSGA